MLPHSLSALDSVAVQDGFLKVGAEEEGEEFKADHTVQLLQREAVEIGMQLRELGYSFSVSSPGRELLIVDSL